MSLFQRKSALRIEFAPDQVNLIHTQRRLSLRGLRTVVWNQRLPSAALETDAEPWRGALQALEKALPAHAGRMAHASLILSSRLVRYVLVPWSDSLRDAAEETAYARHCFDRVYGDVAGQWELRVSADRDGVPMLASAVDAALLVALRGVFATAGVRLDSIQPNLMSVYNDYRCRLRNRHARLALLEQDNLCLAMLHDGHWTRIRSMRIGPAWRDELVLALERESYLADPEAATQDVFLWVSGLANIKLPEIERWRFHVLTARPRRGLAPADEGRFRLAMEG